jgi:glycerophosphoryl diester phosphodiesterase
MTLTPLVALALGGSAAAAASMLAQELPVPSASSAMSRPIVIAHRGASGHRPEHTLEAYRLAVEQGTDYIEPDLVATRDGVLVARHENEIGGTTDVADAFPERKTVKQIDGRRVEGWFTEDFTLVELKRLRARERLSFRSRAHDDRHAIPTFDEILSMLDEVARSGRRIGVYPETKHPTYFQQIGLPLEPRLLDVLDAHGWRPDSAPVFIQSFEVGNLRWLRARTRFKLVQLLDAEGGPFDLAGTPEAITYAEMAAPGGLRRIAGYAEGVGLNTRLVIPVGEDGALRPATTIVTRAHEAGLFVHVWTLRSEPQFLAPGYGGDPSREYRQLADLGVDGIFTDFPDAALIALAGRPRR